MPVFEPMVRRQPDATQAAQNIKQTLAQLFAQMEQALCHVKMLTERHGRGSVEDALGDDAKEVVRLYSEIRKVIEKNKPNTKIDDLPQ